MSGNDTKTKRAPKPKADAAPEEPQRLNPEDPSTWPHEVLLQQFMNSQAVIRSTRTTRNSLQDQLDVRNAELEGAQAQVAQMQAQIQSLTDEVHSLREAAQQSTTH